MSARRFSLLAALALFVAFVAGNVISNSWFRSWRLDLTENHLYSLSEGTVRTLADLTEPVELTLYYSRDGAALEPSLQAYAARVREMLQTFQARSHGRVRFVEVDVKPFSEEEDAAVEAGVEPIVLFEGADPLYLGLVGANAIDDRVVLPFVAPQREAFLEYEVTKLIFELENPERTRVGLITSLPLNPGVEAEPVFGPPPQESMFSAEMGRLLDVTKLEPDFTSIPDVDVLAIIHPGELSPAQLYAIDQFILRKGRAFIALDPAALAADQSGGLGALGLGASAPPSSTLEPLLARWGVAMTPGVVLDLDNALPVQAQDPRTGQPVQAPQPLFFRAAGDQLDREDLMTAWLQRGINFGLAGALTVSEREGVTVTRLVQTGGRTMRMPAEQAMLRPSPFEILQMWPASGSRVETVALRLSGNLSTAFPGGPPPAEEAATPPAVAPAPAPPSPQPPPAAAPSPPLTASATPAEIVIVADVDFLDDNFYADRRNNVAVADNAAFALNALDVLGGSAALVSLRSRAPSQRPMELIDEMEREAQRRIRRRQEDLQAELEETQDRLAALQARGGGSGFFTGNLGAELTSEENAEIERFRQRVLEVRGELRTVGRDLRGDVERLQAGLVFLNVWLAPMLVAGAGLLLFWRRQRRGRKQP